MLSDVSPGLDELQHRLARIRELIEWCKLERDERSRGHALWPSRSTTEHDLDTAFGSFMSLASDLDSILAQCPADTPVASRQRATWQEQLTTIVASSRDLWEQRSQHL